MFGVFAASGNVRVFKSDTSKEETNFPRANNKILPLDSALRPQVQYVHEGQWSEEVSRIAIDKRQGSAGFVVSVCRKNNSESKHSTKYKGVVSLIFFDNDAAFWDNQTHDATVVQNHVKLLMESKIPNFTFPGLINEPLIQELKVCQLD